MFVALRALAAVLKPVVIGISISLLLLPVLYVNPNHFSSGAEARDPTFGRVEDPLGNLAAAVMRSAGAIGKDPSSDDWIRYDNPADCASSSLARAVIWAEMYNRPQWWRRLEFDLARLRLQLLGEAPDWSFGIGQIRLSTARKAYRHFASQLEEPVKSRFEADPSDDELLTLLESSCDNALLVSVILESIATKDQNSLQSPAAVANLYRGGENDGEAVFNYPTVVEFLTKKQIFLQGDYISWWPSEADNHYDFDVLSEARVFAGVGKYYAGYVGDLFTKFENLRTKLTQSDISSGAIVACLIGGIEPAGINSWIIFHAIDSPNIRRVIQENELEPNSQDSPDLKIYRDSIREFIVESKEGPKISVNFLTGSPGGGPFIKGLSNALSVQVSLNILQSFLGDKIEAVADIEYVFGAVDDTCNVELAPVDDGHGLVSIYLDW